MTPEMIGTLVAIVVALAALAGWISKSASRTEARLMESLSAFEKRVDERFDLSEQRNELRFSQMDGRFEQIERRFTQIDRRFEQVDAQLHELATDNRAIRADLSEVKVSVARLEGPEPRLLTAR